MKTIEEIAREAGSIHPEMVKTLEAFAAFVRADERMALSPRFWTKEMQDAWHKAIPDVVLAFDELIRARGNT